VVGLARSKYLANYAGGSIAVDRVSHTGQVEIDGPEEKRYPGLLVWNLSVRQTTSLRKNVFVEKTSKMSRMGLIKRRES
jgi:hypothetical protein